MARYVLSLLCALLAGLATAQTAPQTLTPVDPPQPAPEFVLDDVDGVAHRLADYRGRPLIVNFWATWCPPCREEMPSLERARAALSSDGIEVLAINVGEDAETVFRFTADYPVTFPLLLDIDSAVIGAWPVRGLPTTFVLDPAGRIAYRAIGGRAWDDPSLLRQVRELLVAK
jgi:thiol-disulfide isomerase/thioredoxin